MQRGGQIDSRLIPGRFERRHQSGHFHVRMLLAKTRSAIRGIARSKNGKQRRIRVRISGEMLLGNERVSLETLERWKFVERIVRWQKSLGRRFEHQNNQISAAHRAEITRINARSRRPHHFTVALRKRGRGKPREFARVHRVAGPERGDRARKNICVKWRRGHQRPPRRPAQKNDDGEICRAARAPNSARS